MAFLRKRPEEPKIDLTPMVDVVFLLLIFFMISTTFVETPGIDVKLPESSARILEKEPEEIKVHVTARGEIYFEDERVSGTELRQRLASFQGRAGETTFLLLADRETRHGKVVEVMDLARDAGFNRLAIATEASRTP